MNVRGIGTDIVECLRVAKMIEKHEDVFIQRVYTPDEIEYCGGRLRFSITRDAGQPKKRS